MNDKPIDFTKPIQTRDGRKARVICTDFLYPVGPVIALITDAAGNEFISRYNKEGRIFSTSISDLDLINVPEVQVRYVPLWKDGDYYYATYAGASRSILEDKNPSVVVKFSYDDTGNYTAEIVKDGDENA